MVRRGLLRPVYRNAFAAFLGLLVFAGPPLSAQAPAWVGEWRLDAARSDFAPSPYVRGTRRLELTPSGVRIVEDFVRPRGGTVHLEWTGALDGREQRVHGVDLYVTYAYRQTDERTLEGVVRVDGVIVSRSRETLSPDARTLTVETTAADAQSRTAAVYVRAR
jgi:hypothetical protein